MSEQHEKLRETLRELEEELAALDSIDPETRAVLETSLADILQVLHRKEAEAAEDHPHSLGERLQEVAGELETSHPNLFGIIRRTVNALGQMGI